MNYIELLNMFYERIQCSRVSNNAQLLYYTLLAINNKCSWSDWFSRTNVSISGLMGISEKSFINARAELKQLGLIDFIPSKKRGECTKYRILYPTNYSTKDSTNDSTKCSTDAVQTTVQTPDINKLKHKHKQNNNNTPITPYYQNSQLNQAVLDFVAARKAMKAPMTERAIKMLIKRLDELGRDDDEKIAMLEEAILNGWKGVWPPKRRDTKQRGVEEYAEPGGESGPYTGGLVSKALAAGLGKTLEDFSDF